MKKLLFALLTISVILFSGCKDNNGKKTTYLPSVSGAAYEVLLVIDDSLYRTPAGEAMYYVLNMIYIGVNTLFVVYTRNLYGAVFHFAFQRKY